MAPEITGIEGSHDTGLNGVRPRRELIHRARKDQAVDRVPFSLGFLSLEVGRKSDLFPVDGRLQRAAVGEQGSPDSIGIRDQDRSAAGKGLIAVHILRSPVHSASGLFE